MANGEYSTPERVPRRRTMMRRSGLPLLWRAVSALQRKRERHPPVEIRGVHGRRFAHLNVSQHQYGAAMQGEAPPPQGASGGRFFIQSPGLMSSDEARRGRAWDGGCGFQVGMGRAYPRFNPWGDGWPHASDGGRKCAAWVAVWWAVVWGSH